MRKIELNMNEELKYNVIKNLIDHQDQNGKISMARKNKTSLKLDLSIRQIDRLIKKNKRDR